MHGLIHVVLKDFILSRFGEGTWRSVLGELRVTDDAAVLDLKQYDDAISVAAVHAVVTVLATTWDDALRALGAHLVEYTYTGGHLRMLESMGDSIQEFLQNMDHLHSHLERKIRGSRFPSFHVSDEEEDGFRLSYASARGVALVALVEGKLQAAAKLLHRQAISMQLDAEPLPGFSATWRVKVGRLNSAVGEPPVVADRRGALVRGAAWHHALVSCFNFSCCAEPAGGPTGAEVVHEASCTDLFSDCSPYSAASRASISQLDELECKAKGLSQPADLLMRAVSSLRVSARWEDAGCLAHTEEFWRTSDGDICHFQLASPAQRATRFVSHSWFEPANWQDVMGSKCSYAAMKSTELQLAATEIAADSGCNLENVTFWIDKCCIPQQHSLKDLCISMIEEFLDRCDGMVVLLTWEYFQRLWCVYEWAAFLVRHPLENLTICMETFLRPSSRQLHIEAIRNLTVDNCKCSRELDRTLLKQKVAQYYTSEANFETLARCSAIALIVRALCRSASRSMHTWEEEVVPFLNLARDLGLVDLAEALESADPWRWRMTSQKIACSDVCVSNTRGSITEVKEWQPLFNYSIDCWFDDRVAPVLQRTKRAAVRPDFADSSDIHGSLSEARKWHTRKATGSKSCAMLVGDCDPQVS